MDGLDAATPILIPYDGSRPADAALTAAGWLAAPDATVLLLQVLPEPEPIRNVVGDTIVSRDEIGRLAHEAAESELVHAAEHLHRHLPRVRVETIENVGDPAATIVALARERLVRLIVLAR
ncbi:MAG TPA: universal stress protein, partial [Thermomicrobiales bacterium]|nr:universal stress protein [Thermomicrobiales bacterium]